jgi:plasmid stability protein
MAAVTVRNLPAETLRALKLRAARGGRSTEAEIREILANAVRTPFGVGSALAGIGRNLGGVAPRAPLKHSAVRPARFE